MQVRAYYHVFDMELLFVRELEQVGLVINSCGRVNRYNSDGVVILDCEDRELIFVGYLSPLCQCCWVPIRPSEDGICKSYTEVGITIPRPRVSSRRNRSGQCAIHDVNALQLVT